MIKVVEIKQILDSLILFVKDDYESKTNKEETFLYRVLSGSVEGNFNFYEQGVVIFTQTDENALKIETTLSFSQNSNGSPSIYVREASRVKGTFNSIGGMASELYVYEDGSVGDEYRDTKKGDYELVITSTNNLVTILISEVIYSLFVSAYETLNTQYELFDFNLKEVMFQNTTGTRLFAKTITMSTQQENIIPSLISEEQLNKVMFKIVNINGQPLTE